MLHDFINWISVLERACVTDLDGREQEMPLLASSPSGNLDVISVVRLSRIMLPIKTDKRHVLCSASVGIISSANSFLVLVLSIRSDEGQSD